ncbi:hypothetical protein BJI47_16960 [Rhodococcus sp. 1168]|nr:hypothetical protein BJI47_16960 [Rhodococcus sp. 1168]
MALIDIGTLVGVLAAVLALFIQVRQRKFALAQQYIERFWEIDDSISRAECVGVDVDINLHHRRYAKLCEDEMEVVSLGWIDRRTWHVWHAGIVSSTSTTRTVKTESEFDFLHACRMSSTHDGSHCPAWAAQSLWPRATSW